MIYCLFYYSNDVWLTVINHNWNNCFKLFKGFAVTHSVCGKEIKTFFELILFKNINGAVRINSANNMSSQKKNPWLKTIICRSQCYPMWNLNRQHRSKKQRGDCFNHYAVRVIMIGTQSVWFLFYIWSVYKGT